MPVLKTYTAQIGPAPAVGGRRASAEDFGASAGLGGAGKALQDFGEKVLDQKEQEESRKALITSTELRAKYARELDEAALSGGDLAALKEKMAADFSKIGEDFATKRGSESVAYYAANSELMFDEQANRIEVQRAAANARLEGSKFLNSAAAIIRSNPNYLSAAEANVDELVKTFPKLRPEQAAEVAADLKQQLNMAAALAAARINPEQTIKDLDGGRWNLKPEDRNTATSQARMEVNARKAEAAYLRAEAERQKNERDDKARDDHFKAIISGTFSQRAVMDDARLQPQTREHLIVFAEQRARALTTQEKASDPVAVRDLWMRIHAPETDPRRIYNGNAIFEAVTKGDINTADATRLNALVANQRDENNQSIGAKISNNMRIVGKAMEADPKFILQPNLVAATQMYYQADVWDKVSEYRAAGKNPNDLFNPANKDFVGAPAFIQSAVSRAQSDMGAKIDEQIPRLSSDPDEADRQFNALSPGSPFIGPDGVQRTKPKGAAAAPSAPTEPSVFEPPRPLEAAKRLLEAPRAPLPKTRPIDALRRKPERLPGED